jgi:hypothetical protein
VPRRICGPKRDEMVGSWRNLHNEELHGLYSSPNIIRMAKSRRLEEGRKRNACRVFVGMPKRK